MNRPIENAADPVKVSEAKTKARRQEVELKDDWLSVLKTPEGRRVMWHVLTYCKPYASIFHASALIYHNSGRQDVGHFIMSQIEDADPKLYIKMLEDRYNGDK